MTAATQPAPARPGTGDEKWEPVHFVCCLDEVAMCGQDLTDELEVEDADPEEVCAMCQLVFETDRPCPVPGCVPRHRQGRESKWQNWWKGSL